MNKLNASVDHAVAPAAPALEGQSSGASAPPAPESDSSFEQYLRRYPARRTHWELGAFVGTVLISDNNAFRGAVARSSLGKILGPYSQFSQPSLELGARGAYLLLPYLGAELEGFFAPTSTERGGSASVLGARAQLIAQMPKWSITPFVLAGAGLWWIANDVSGNDRDPAFHIGAGAKAALSEAWSVRLDLRDSITSGREGNGVPNHVEALAGAHFEFGAPPPAALEPPVVAARPMDPPPVVPALPEPLPADTDGDGITDANDECPAAAGVAPSGCPDTDGDQILDRDDACPGVAGLAPQGCPEPAPVAAAPETFSGVIEGIEFDSGQDQIRLTSHAALDAAVAVLVQHTELRVEVVGHTDNQGSRSYNVKLSQQRAESVKRYLVQHGVDESRVQARGVGPDEPLAANDSDSARQKNRRIEFRVSH
jgi:outer membrane protein OmpA-like peptidoglycan-associated protein